MRRAIKVLAVLVLLAVLGLGLGHVGARMVPLAQNASLQTHPLAAAELSHTQRDFGTVTQGEVLREEFQVNNTGTRRLVFQRDVPGCCGEPAETQAVIVPPGGSATLPIELDTATLAGVVDHVVEFTTNDPEMPRFSLTLRADVRPADSDPGL